MGADLGEGPVDEVGEVFSGHRSGPVEGVHDSDDRRHSGVSGSNRARLPLSDRTIAVLGNWSRCLAARRLATDLGLFRLFGMTAGSVSLGCLGEAFIAHRER